MNTDNKIPVTPKILLSDYQDTITNYMHLGLLPFFIGAFGPWVFIANEPFFIQSFLFYSSLIFVFLAGSVWATALIATPKNTEPQNTNIDNDIDNHIHNNGSRTIHVAMVFSLWPLGCYFLAPLYATGLMLLGFLLLLLWEKKHLNQYYPAWYIDLRHKITFIVIACHMLTILNIIRTDTLI